MSTVHLQTVSESVLSTSDRDLLLRLSIVLALKKRAGWHLVRFAVQHGVVQLAGLVPTSYDRQLIAALTSHVAGVRRVDDQLAVGEPSLRRELEDVDADASGAAGKTADNPPQNQFLHLPVLPESLDDMLARSVTKPEAA
jgi:hypothetical protein